MNSRIGKNIFWRKLELVTLKVSKHELVKMIYTLSITHIFTCSFHLRAHSIRTKNKISSLLRLDINKIGCYLFLFEVNSNSDSLLWCATVGALNLCECCVANWSNTAVLVSSNWWINWFMQLCYSFDLKLPTKTSSAFFSICLLFEYEFVKVKFRVFFCLNRKILLKPKLYRRRKNTKMSHIGVTSTKTPWKHQIQKRENPTKSKDMTLKSS